MLLLYLNYPDSGYFICNPVVSMQFSPAYALSQLYSDIYFFNYRFLLQAHELHKISFGKIKLFNKLSWIAKRNRFVAQVVFTI